MLDRLSRKVTLVKCYGTDGESRREVLGHVQPDTGFFSVDTPIEEGDVVELPDPRVAGAVRRLTVAKVKIYDGFNPRMDHIEVKWGDPPRSARPKPRPFAMDGMHPDVSSVAAALYADGHCAQAVFEAFKAVEVRVREMTSIDESGRGLMSRAFTGPNAPLRLTRKDGRFGADEHDGRTLVFMGSMQAIRNLGGHEVDELDATEALQELALASLLMHWLDDATIVSA